mmetsp:Transcript_19134/g.45328  ORF Transcript_19134/g.45328 Transcript_19134/m.45328 type:complete len:164 (+) Transcript_19134:52-543(+)
MTLSRTLVLLASGALLARQVAFVASLLQPEDARAGHVSRAAVGRPGAGAPPGGFSEAFRNPFQEESFYETYKPREKMGLNGQPMPTATRAWFYALTNIRIREKADVSSRALGTVIRKGEVFEIDAELAVQGQKYLKLAKQAGWVFTRGLSGEWKGREIAKRSP